MAEGYCLKMGLDEGGEVIGYQFVHLGKMMEAIRKGMDPKEAYEKRTSILTAVSMKPSSMLTRERNKEARHGTIRRLR